MGSCVISTFFDRKRLTLRLIANKGIPATDGVTSNKNERNRYKRCESEQR